MNEMQTEDLFHPFQKKNNGLLSEVSWIIYYYFIAYLFLNNFEGRLINEELVVSKVQDFFFAMMQRI